MCIPAASQKVFATTPWPTVHEPIIVYTTLLETLFDILTSRPHSFSTILRSMHFMRQAADARSNFMSSTGIDSYGHQERGGSAWSTPVGPCPGRSLGSRRGRPASTAAHTVVQPPISSPECLHRDYAAWWASCQAVLALSRDCGITKEGTRWNGNRMETPCMT